MLDSLSRFVDQLRDLLGGLAGPFRELPHLVGDHGEPEPVLARPRRFNGGVEREQVGLGGDLADHLDDVVDLLRRPADRPHRVDGIVDSLAASLGQLRGAARLSP